MTIEELYNWAVKNNIQNKKLCLLIDDGKMYIVSPITNKSISLVNTDKVCVMVSFYIRPDISLYNFSVNDGELQQLGISANSIEYIDKNKGE